MAQLRSINKLFFVLIIGLIPLFGCQTTQTDSAHQSDMVGTDKVSVHMPWARATPGHARAGAAFMVLDNPTATADRLVAAYAGVSKTVELHTHIQEGAVMRMRQVPHIDLPAGEKVELRPGGLHIMFIGLNAPLSEGERFPLTLEFSQAGKIDVEVHVKGAGSDHSGMMRGKPACHGQMDGKGMHQGMHHGHMMQSAKPCDCPKMDGKPCNCPKMDGKPCDCPKMDGKPCDCPKMDGKPCDCPKMDGKPCNCPKMDGKPCNCPKMDGKPCNCPKIDGKPCDCVKMNNGKPCDCPKMDGKSCNCPKIDGKPCDCAKMNNGKPCDCMKNSMKGMHGKKGMHGGHGHHGHSMH
ncbi:MAG: copper chaperone PCu(A)C [Magnetococcales bacterium]|nr:copper chaperone PCu(A)C [Magnetococcales bacterium]